jgi:multidrug resistance efflux pump
MVLADFSLWYVETSDLTENEVVKIQIGDAAIIVPDALSDVSLTGTVEAISDAYTEKSGDIIYKTKILLKDPDERLRWGMTVEIRFEESK